MGGHFTLTFWLDQGARMSIWADLCVILVLGVGFALVTETWGSFTRMFLSAIVGVVIGEVIYRNLLRGWLGM